jgi:hypothetical protein
MALKIFIEVLPDEYVASWRSSSRADSGCVICDRYRKGINGFTEAFVPFSQCVRCIMGEIGNNCRFAWVDFHPISLKRRNHHP